MERPSARHRALAALVLTDFCLKLAARAFLRGKAGGIWLFGPIGLGYVENSSGFGFDQTRILATYGLNIDDAFVVCSLAVFLLLAVIVRLWSRIKLRTWAKVLGAALIYAASAYLALAICESIHISLSPYLRGLLRSLGPLAVALALYAELRRPYFSALATLFFAGTIGNCASLLLPPFVVIDYFGMYRASIDGYVYANAADAFLVIAMLGLALSPIYLLVARHARTKRVERAARSAVPDDGGLGDGN
jgi:hypothetical protein